MCRLVNIKTNYGTEVKVADIKADIISGIVGLASICDKIDYIYLFGSSLEERCTEKSDIDLAIISNVTRSKLYRASTYDKFLDSVYELKIGQDYDVLQFNSMEEIKKRKEAVCRDILTEGKLIYSRKGGIVCTNNIYQKL